MGHNPELETWQGKQDELSSNPILKVMRKPLTVPVRLLSVDWLHGLQLGIVHGRKKKTFTVRRFIASTCSVGQMASRRRSEPLISLEAPRVQ